MYFKIAISSTAFFVIFLLNNQLQEYYKGQPYPFPELRHLPEMPLAAYNPVTIEGAELGRFLFYDPILSQDSSISCSSCHQQQFAFSDGPKRFSTGINGAKMKRNTMPLFNLAWYPSLFWDGKSPSLEKQVFHPVSATDEMNLQWPIAEKRIQKSSFYPALFKKAFGDAVKIDSTTIAKAIAQFERTLLSYNSKYDQVLRREAFFTKDEYDGFVLVNDQSMADCFHCHVTDAHALGTTARFSNNGLNPIYNSSDYNDKGKGAISGRSTENGLFRIPSLRNVALTAPYMHDGRFETLEEVLDFYSEGVNLSANVDSKMTRAHQGGVKLNAEEKRKIILFLNTLSDSVLITNPSYGNPFLPTNQKD